MLFVYLGAFILMSCLIIWGVVTANRDHHKNQMQAASSLAQQVSSWVMDRLADQVGEQTWLFNFHRNLEAEMIKHLGGYIDSISRIEFTQDRMLKVFQRTVRITQFENRLPDVKIVFEVSSGKAFAQYLDGHEETIGSLKNL
ncbi:MAG: hypothetical protein ACD_83C00110G0001 [uncultured bacterium]|nr:MAG: hypothetical protein ACD_83C00110G0001 [uncultured bacterium]